jgi:hypothetical protein
MPNGRTRRLRRSPPVDTITTRRFIRPGIDIIIIVFLNKDQGEGYSAALNCLYSHFPTTYRFNRHLVECKPKSKKVGGINRWVDGCDKQGVIAVLSWASVAQVALAPKRVQRWEETGHKRVERISAARGYQVVPRRDSCVMHYTQQLATRELTNSNS